MKRLFIILNLMTTVFSSCTEDNITGTNNPAEIYYPLKIANTWYYDVNTSDNNPHIKRIVDVEVLIDGRSYYIINEIYGSSSEYSHNYKDTLRNDTDGKIWKHVNGEDYLLYDFSLNDGDTYKYSAYSLNGEDDYIVTFHNLGKIETDKGVYENCLGFFFDIPQFIDDEKWYIFAPNIGLIKETAGEGPTIILNSYSF